MKESIALSLLLVACTVFAAPPEEKVAEKAAMDAWRQLKKDATTLVKRDFTGGFSNYWHTNIDAARALYETVFTNAVMRNAEKIDACREIALCHLEATRDESAALAALDRAFTLADLTDADRARAERNRHEIKVLMRREEKTPEELEREKPRPRPPQAPKPRVETATERALKDVQDSKAALTACQALLAEKGGVTNVVAYADQLADAARVFLRRGDEKTARDLWSAREKLVPPRRTARLICPWWKEAPHDVRGVLQSEVYAKAEKGLLVRKYGDNLKFLIETDSATLGREMTTDRGEKFRPTELFCFWDAEGVKIFLRSYVGNMTSIRAGEAHAPGYEMYLATGVDDPYHCLLFDPSEGGKLDDGFITQYDNGTGYRNLRDAKSNLRSESLYLEDGVATLISVPWTGVFASLPPTSPIWYMEVIHWAHGGLSFGGSVSVHNRSSFGELAFTGVGPAELALIKRRLLFAAKTKLETALSARMNGSAERWADPELGDQAFFLAGVQPFVNRLKAETDRLVPGLSDAEAAEIYDRVGEEALNIDYRISALRTKWLLRKLTEKGKE